MYTIELLQAINDWQAEGFEENKQDLAKKIKKESARLHKKFKTLNENCFRRVDLVGKHTLQIGTELKLPETYSSWTFDVLIAQNFYDGVPEVGYQGVIFKLNPSDNDYEVIINLNELFSDKDFTNFCEKYKAKINNYDNGIGRFGNYEKELVLDVSELKMEQIYAYGGYSSSKEYFAQKYFGHSPNAEELIFFKKLLKKDNIPIGAKWVTGRAKDRIVKFHINKAKLLAKH